jgi:membrane protein involved in colicin uptake
VIDRLEEINSYRERVLELVVTDESQTELMQQAKEGADYLRETRQMVEGLHKDLKARALAEGRLVDSVKKFLIGEFEPLENHLKTQRDFVKIQAAKKAAEEAKKQAEEDARQKEEMRKFEAEKEQALIKLAQEAKAREDAANEALREAERKAKAEAAKVEADRLAAEKEANEKIRAAEKAAADAVENNRRLEAEAEAARLKVLEMTTAKPKADDDRELCCPHCGGSFLLSQAVGGF